MVQVYNPCGSACMSTLMAGLPIVLLLGLVVLAEYPRLGRRQRPWRRRWGGNLRLRHACVGPHSPRPDMARGLDLLPIGWIVVLRYISIQLTSRAGQFEIVSRSGVAAIVARPEDQPVDAI